MSDYQARVRAAAEEKLKRLGLEILPAALPPGQEPGDSTRMSLERNAGWLYRWAVRGERSKAAIARCDDVNRAVVIRGINTAIECLGEAILPEE